MWLQQTSFTCHQKVEGVNYKNRERIKMKVKKMITKGEEGNRKKNCIWLKEQWK